MQRPKQGKSTSFKLPQNDAELNQAAALLNSGNFQAAEQLYRRVLKRYAGNPYILHDLGQCLYKLNRPKEAEQVLRMALRRNPQFEPSHLVLADTLLALGQPDAAVQLLRKAVHDFPNSEAITRGLVNVLIALSMQADAIPELEAFIKSNPTSVWALNLLGDALNASLRPQDALTAYNRSLELDPDQAAAAKAAGDVAVRLKQFQLAEALFAKAYELAPENKFLYHFSMGDLREKQSRYREALQFFKLAIEFDPDKLGARNRVFILSNLLTQFVDAKAQLVSDSALLNMTNARYFGFTLFAGSTTEYLSDSEIFAAHQVFDKLHAVPTARQMNVRSARSHPRLRIGFLSGDFKSHPVAKFALPLFKALSQLDVDLFAYSNVPMEDAVTQKFKEAVPFWRSIRHLPDEEAAKSIAKDALDVLVDLSGHTNDNRLPILQWRPAPVQCTYLGYTATTGLSSVDYWILDDIVFPKNSTESTSESIYRLPRPWVAYPLNESVQIPHRLTKDPRTPFIFGSANAQKKMSASTYQLFADVLRAVPDSLLLLKNPEVGTPEIAQVVRAQFQALGVDPQRILLAGFSQDFNEHAATIQQIDIALDTTPFSGGTTTCETLWMGVPVLTLTGPRFVNRMSSSMLAYLGLQEWTCATSEEFVAKAILYSLDDEGLCEFRSTIRERMRNSPLCDPVDLAGHLYRAFQQMREVAAGS